MNKIREYLLLALIRWYVRNYRFPAVLSCFWGEFRNWYPEDNLPSALDSVIETLKKCEEELQ